MVKVDGLEPGLKEAMNGLVKYGEAYRLKPDLAQQLTNFQDAEQLVGSSLQFQSYTFDRDASGWYCYPAKHGQPEIGDFRVRVEYVLDGPASVLALQMVDKTGNRTFGPYRTVPRPLCGSVDSDELKRRRTAAATKEADEIYHEEKCWDFGPFCCLCACCNLVTACLSAAMPPQIYSIWPGQMSKVGCFDSERMFAAGKKWGIRLLSWLFLWIGFTMLFEPLSVIVDIITFLGPYLGSGLSWVIGLFTFLLTIAIATLLVSIAYLIYRPLIGIVYLTMTVGVFAAIHIFSQQAPTAPGIPSF